MLIACFCSGHWRLDPIVYFDRNDVYWQLWPKSERVADCLVGNIVDKNIVQKLWKAKTLIIKQLQRTRGNNQQYIKGSLGISLPSNLFEFETCSSRWYLHKTRRSVASWKRNMMLASWNIILQSVELFGSVLINKRLF